MSATTAYDVFILTSHVDGGCWQIPWRNNNVVSILCLFDPCRCLIRHVAVQKYVKYIGFIDVKIK